MRYHPLYIIPPLCVGFVELEQLEFFEIPSPCIGVCQAGQNGYCLGCYRSRDERLYWIQLDSDVKRQIIKACQRRKKRALMAKKSTSEETENPVQSSLWNEQDQNK